MSLRSWLAEPSDGGGSAGVGVSVEALLLRTDYVSSAGSSLLIVGGTVSGEKQSGVFDAWLKRWMSWLNPEVVEKPGDALGCCVSLCSLDIDLVVTPELVDCKLCSSSTALFSSEVGCLDSMTSERTPFLNSYSFFRCQNLPTSVTCLPHLPLRVPDVLPR